MCWGQHKFSYSPLFQNHRENMFWGPLAVSSIERFIILWYSYYEGSLINQNSNEAVYTHCCLCPAYTYEPLSSGEISGWEASPLGQKSYFYINLTFHHLRLGT